MGIWQILIRKEKFILYGLNHIASIRNFFKIKKRENLKKNNAAILKNIHASDRVVIVMNGPSIKEQEFSKLIGEDVIFGNRGFVHPLYKDIHPKFHVFVDPKFPQGVWPITWLDDILEMVPDITFIMPAAWAHLSILQPYIVRGVRFFWLFETHSFVGGMGVAGASIRGAINLGYKNILITGFEKTGFASELLKVSSHFYGINSENSLKTWDDYTLDFYMNFSFYIGAKESAKQWKKKGINIVNITKGGVVEVFARQSFDDVFPKH